MPTAARRPTAILAAAILAASLAGCGDGAESEEATTNVANAPAPELTKAELKLIARTEERVAAYCREVGAAVARGRAPSAESFAAVSAELERLGELAAEKPESPTGDGSSPRLALGDIAENLEGTNCDSRLVARIDTALAEIP